MITYCKKYLLIAAISFGFIQSSGSQCIGTFQYPNNAVNINNNGLPIIIDPCNLPGDYARTTGHVQDVSYSWESSIETDYLTLTSDAAGQNILVHGVSPIDYPVENSNDLYIHVHINSQCTVSSTGCRQISVKSTNTCIAPMVENIAVSYLDCPNSVGIDFEITDLGSSGELTVTNDAGGTNPAIIKDLGVYSVVDLPYGPVTISIHHESDSDCDIQFGPLNIGCPPLNDICTDALDVTAQINAGQFSDVNNLYANHGAGPFPIGDCNTFYSWCTQNGAFAYRDVWYKITPNVNGCFGFLSVSTLGSNFDTKIAIYDSCGGTVISGNDDFFGSGNGFTSLTTAAVQNNQTYYIQVAGYSQSSFGDVMLDLVLVDIDSSIPNGSGIEQADFECLDVNGWTHYVNTISGKLLFSANKNSQDIGWIPITANVGCELSVGSSAIDLGVDGDCGGAFYANVDHWVVMNRTWDLQVETQPANPVTVRFYYDDLDFFALNDGLANAGIPPLAGQEEVIHYMIHQGDVNLNSNPCHADNNNGLASFEQISGFTKGNFCSFNYAEYSVGSFSGGGGGAGEVVGSGPLPTELVQFNGRVLEFGNLLTWKISSQENVDYYSIERSFDSFSDWISLGRINAGGQSMDEKDFSFIDETIVEQAYYRLRIYDFDESYTTSRLVELKRLIKGFEISNIYPNPAENIFEIEFNSDANTTVEMNIIDITGKQMLNENLSAQYGVNKYSINVSDLSRGTYFIELTNGINSKTYKLLIQ